MIWWIVLLLVAVVVTLLVVRRRRRRVRPPVLVAERAPMPEVLVEEVEAPPSLAEEPSFAQRLSSSRSLFDRVRSLGARSELSEEQLAVVEEVLLRSDVGVETTNAILARLAESGAPDGIVDALRSELRASLDRPREVRREADEGRIPVWLFVGVNGVGKTTSIGKLAYQETQAGRRVLLAAGDTFRAAAADQLTQWAERTGADVVRAEEGADPGSVVHDALGRAQAREIDLVLADTAGRRVNSSNLIDELAKIRRVADRGPGQVVETFMVLDATTGQNALSQAREFLAAAQVSGIILTKLDGTARGGIVVALERELAIPVKYVGVGERAMDLVVFEPDVFVDSLLGTSG